MYRRWVRCPDSLKIAESQLRLRRTSRILKSLCESVLDSGGCPRAFTVTTVLAAAVVEAQEVKVEWVDADGEWQQRSLGEVGGFLNRKVK